MREQVIEATLDRMSARQVVLVALFALAEASVIEPLILLLPTPLRLIDPGVALVITWLVLGAIAFTRRAMALREASLSAQRVALGAWLVGLLVAFIAIVAIAQQIDPRSLSIVFVEFIGVLALWWRGAALGVTSLGPDSARLRLQMGLLIFVMFALVTIFNPHSNVFGFVLPFMVGALSAMPLSHVERVEQSELGRHVPMDARWWRSLFIGVAVPLVLCIAITLVVSGEALTSGMRLLVAIIMVPIILLSAVVAFIIGMLIMLLFNGAQRNPMEPLQGFADFLNRLRDRPEANTDVVFNIPPDVRFVIGVLVLAAIIGALIWLTGRARREAAVVRAEGVELQDLGEDDGPPPIAESNLFRSLSLRRWLAVLNIRRIYARMSHEAGKRGFGRLSSQTPYDFLPRLGEAFPGAGADAHLITNAYVAAHYGEVPDTDEALAEIRAAWRRVRATPRRVPPAAPSSPQSP